MKTYKAKRGRSILFIIGATAILLLLIFFQGIETFTESPYMLLLLLSPLAILLWHYFDTSYRVEKDILYYRSGFLRGKIDVKDIKKITIGKTMWAGFKPALAQNGLIIRYKRSSEVYLAPESNDKMVTDLLRINPDIKMIVKE